MKNITTKVEQRQVGLWHEGIMFAEKLPGKILTSDERAELYNSGNGEEPPFE